MPKPLDDAMKKLVGGNPQDFVSWMLRRARLLKQLPYELSSENTYADALLEVLLDEKELLLHIEFQSSNDARIGERLLEYNVLASRQYNYLPVCSYVIYLKRDGNVPKSPFIRRLPTGEEVVRFYYKIIELWEIASEELLQTELIGLLPLLPLTKDGARHEVVEKMITGLVSAGKTESLWIGYALASKVLTADLNWLRRRFAVFSDILRETPIYQEVLEEGLEKGIEKGREEALQQARQEKLQEQRQALLNVLMERFPKIVRLVRKQVEDIEDPAILWHLIVKMSTAQTAEEAKQLLFNVAGDEEKNS